MLRAAKNGQSAGRRKPPQRLNGKRPGPGEDTVYSRCRWKSAEKYRETGGTKDIKNDNYTTSWFHRIDKAPWENDGNSQGADQVVTIYSSRVSRPRNPTRVLSIRWTAPEDVPAGTVVSVPCPANLYDCTTWADYIDPSAYEYYGYRYSRHSADTETKTVLAQSGSTAMQNFAFDMEDID